VSIYVYDIFDLLGIINPTDVFIVPLKIILSKNLKE